MNDGLARFGELAIASRLPGEVNPEFWKGTVVEKQAAEVLARNTTVTAR